MASSWFLKLAFKCVDHFAWPLLALWYPLFQFWPYIKLIIIFWLIVPGFGRASYVYNNLIRLCISMKQSVICRLNNYWRNFFVEKDNFLQHVERYIKENETEALEKLIASKANSPLLKITMNKPNAEAANAIRATDDKEMQQNTTIKSNAEAANAIRAIDNKEMQLNTMNEPDAEASNAIRATNNKEMQPNTMIKPVAEAANAIRATDNKEMQPTNGKRLQTKDEDIKDMEVIEKKEIPVGKHDILVMPNLTPSKNASSAMVETKGIAGKDTAGGELPESSSSHMEVQKEWTCALCQVTATCEKDLNSPTLVGGNTGLCAKL